jgi:hypothetical protein
MMALAGHMTREMMEHYGHVRMAAKREALDKLSGGLMKVKGRGEATKAGSRGTGLRGYVTIHVTKGQI